MSTAPVVALPQRDYAWQLLMRALVIAVLVIPRILAWSSAGGLWRDEVHSVNIATQTTDDLFFSLTNDSIPLCWQTLLRGWIAVFGSTDSSVRTLGLLIGLAVIPAMWWSARQFGVAFPFWMMILLGLDPSLIVFGGEVRGYGLGIISFLILIGTAWRTLQQPSRWHWFWLVLAALFAVQSSFTNCFLLAGTFISCGLVALQRGRTRICLGFGLIGLLAAASMLPYALFVLPRLRDAVHAIHDPVPMLLPMRVFIWTYRRGGFLRGSLGILVGLVGFCELLRRLYLWKTRQSGQSAADQDVALFLPPFYWIGTIGFWYYMNFLGVQTAYWYHLPWLTLLAITLELGVELVSRHWPRLKLTVATLAVVSGGLILRDVMPTVNYRLTTVDLIARDLEQTVSPGDLVVVSPWYVGISFGRYYHGPADWICLPNVDHIDHHQGYIDQKAHVMPLPSPQAIQAELGKIESVLKSGGRIWWIGPLELLPPGESPLVLAGAPDPQYGWRESVYMKSWQQVTIARMQEIGITATEWKNPQRTHVNLCEDPSVFVVEPVHTRLTAMKRPATVNSRWSDK
ncbi:MAG: hypothetical protein JSS49_14965 [Planctomycetes bacterium]|nr:hypothetical protein [Planctomycetota bacterium]